MKTLLTTTAVALSLFSKPIFAESLYSSDNDRAPINFYVGAEVGLNFNNLADGLPFASTFDDSSEHGGFIAGIRSGHFGVELGFNQTTDAEKSSTVPVFGPVSTETSTKTFSIDFLGYYPLGNYGTDIFGGLGWGYADYDIKIVETAGTTNISDDGDVLRFTAGIEQMISKNLSVRGLYRYSNYGDGDIYDNRNDVSLAVQLYF